MDDMPNNNTQTSEEIVNHEQFEDMRDLLEEDFVDLIQVYFKDSQQRIATLRVAQQANDNANGFETAHALKGASANLGTTQLVRLSSQLQEHCRGRRISEQADLVEEIAVALQRAEQEINLRLGQ
ncbi:Hpt domain-containing protein [Psychrobacter sp. NG254]|uniref:Hpt domain-containing protein n=1 Tax=Psychrobacter sp. NG254 TaxID=2782003 RepID=UPI001888642F|nr:Hpt domain-containing protein [Psychrobacter sp. NG254]MBF2718756.1 Hpt domain-containing protein [Psychrobacter sp. NG254]